MQIVIEGEAAAIVKRLVALGRFASAREAVEDAMRFAEMRERKLQALRADIQAADEEGGEWTMEDVDRDLEEVYRELEKDYP